MLRRKKKVEGKKKKPRKEYWFGNVKCDSGLEVYCHKKLVETGLAYDFHPPSFVLLNGFNSLPVSYEPDERIGKLIYLKTGKIQSIKYTIDFADPLKRWMIETKGYARPGFLIRWKLLKYRLTQDGIRTTLFLPKDHPEVDETIRLILEMKLDKHMSAESPTLFD